MEGGYMNPSRLHQLWQTIESTQANILVTLNDPDLVQCLLERLEEREVLDREGESIARDYIRDRLSLIRELAYRRLTAG